MILEKMDVLNSDKFICCHLDLLVLHFCHDWIISATAGSCILNISLSLLPIRSTSSAKSQSSNLGLANVKFLGCSFTLGQELSKDHFVYALSQWETALQCNAIFHWLGAYTKWSLAVAKLLLIALEATSMDWFSIVVGFNSLAPGGFEQNVRWVIFKLISVTDGWGISCKIALRWIPLDLTNDKSTLVQVMAWCHHATSHYLSQCWPRYLAIWHH